MSGALRGYYLSIGYGARKLIMKRYGIRVTLPEGDTLSAGHLLGENWEQFRWFDSAQERDRMFDEMRRPPPYYRRGDVATQVLEKVDR